MALPIKGWPKQVGRNLKRRGGHLLFLFGKAWRPQNIETSRRRRVRYRVGLRDTSRDPPLTRAAMTRRQIAWIVNQPDKRLFPCYDLCSADEETPFIDADTERILSSPYQDLGVSVTISGHRFISLAEETSWIDKCKGCGNVDAIEFITRCGAQKLCSRNCVQTFIQHRRYRRQIQERPLFDRPITKKSDDRIPEEEIVLEEPVRVKRKYTKRKNLEASKDAKNKSPTGSEIKPVKRAYKKRDKTVSKQKLTVKMPLKKGNREPKSTSDDKSCHQDPASSQDQNTTNLKNSQVYSGGKTMNACDQNKADMSLMKGIKDSKNGAHDILKTSKQQRPEERSEFVTIATEESSSKDHSKHKQISTTSEGSGSFKLGNVKVVLKDCGPGIKA